MKKNLLIVFILLFGMILNAQPQYSGGSNTPPTTPATIPYSCNFENPTENAEWQLSNDVCTNKWFIGTPSNIQAPISGGCLYISNDNGLSNAYTITTPGVVVATRYIQSNGAYQYTLNFDLFIGGESLYDYIKVFVVDVDTNYTGLNGSTYPYYSVAAFNLNQYMVGNAGVPYFNGYNGSSVIAGSYPRSVTIPSMGPAGTVKKLIILWKNDTSTGTMPPASIDNITITPIWCPAPTALTGTNVTNNSINLSWTEVGVATSWNLEYKLNSESVWTEVIGLSTPNYVLNSLDSDSIYNVRVKSNCGTELSVYSNIYTFTTLTFVPATLPYSQDFENPTENAEWKLINGNQTNKFYIGDATQNPAINNTSGGSNALYISNDNGATWAYSGTGTSTNSWVYAYRDFTVPSGVTELKLDFDWIANGGVAASEFLRVYWMPTSIPVVAGAIPPTINSVNYDLTAMIGNYTNGYGSHWLSRQTSWQHATFSINTTQYPTLAGNTWRLYVHWRNNQTTAVQPPATFDNMTLVVSNCPTPRIDSINNITQTSATLNFSEFGITNTWNFQYRILGTNTWTLAQATTNPYILSGLHPSLTYEVRMQSDCSSEQSAWSPIKKFNTSCGTITQIPWADYFDNYGTGTTIFPACWTRKSNLTNAPYITTTNFSSPASMYFYCGSSGNYINASTPMVDASIPINTLMLKFRTYFSGNDDTLYVGTMSNPLDENTFTQIAKFSSTTTATWINQALYLNTYQGSDQYISLRTKYGATSSTIYVDNFEILPMPTCLIPSNLSATNMTSSEVTINWTPGEPTHSSWFIYYKPTTASSWDSVQVSTNPYILTNLMSSTFYQYYMKTDCSNELSEPTNIYTFLTQCDPFTQFPWTEGFETPTTWPAAVAPGNGLAPLCWFNFNGASTSSLWRRTSTASYIRTGTGSAQQYSGGTTVTNNDYLITPVFTLSGNERIRFWAKGDGTSVNKLKVRIYDLNVTGQDVTSMTDTSSFVTIMENTILSNSTWTEYEVLLNQYVGNYRIAFVRDTLQGTYINIDDIVIDAIPSCPDISQLTLLSSTSSTVTLNWTWTTNAGQGFEISYANVNTGFDPNTGTIISVPDGTTLPYVISNLTPGQFYSFAVRQACNGNWSNIVVTNTDGLPAVLPYSCDFSDVNEQASWKISNGNATNRFHIGTPTNVNAPISGANLFISNDYGVTNTYTLTTTSTAIASRLIEFDGSGGYQLNFDLYIGGESSLDYIKVFLTDPDTVFVGTNTTPYYAVSTYNGNNQLLTNYNNTAPYFNGYNGSSIIAGSYPRQIILPYQGPAGTIKRLIILWRNDGSVGTQPPAAIDNIVLQALTCPIPNTIATSNLTSTATDITWIDPSGTASEWIFRWKLASATTWNVFSTYTTNFSLNSLTANTAYNVSIATVCGSDTSVYANFNFSTPCLDITIPYTQNFDSSTGFPTCWTRKTGATNPATSTTYSSSPSNSLYFYASSTFQYAATPPVDINVPVNTLQVSFKLFRTTATYAGVSVGVMTDPNDFSTFQQVGPTVSTNALSTWEDKTVFLNSYTGTGRFIVLVCSNPTGINSFYLDNFEISVIPSCPKPTQLLATNILANSAELNWLENGTATTWNIEYGPTGFTPGTGTMVTGITTMPYQVSGLNAQTTYQFYVQADCGGGDLSSWSNVNSFMTSCSFITTLPWTDFFDTYTTGETIFPTCWTRNTTYANRPYVGTTNVTAPGGLYFYVGTVGTYNIAATPPFDQSIQISSLMANFKYRTVYLTDTLYVGVMTDPNDASTFVLVDKASVTAASAWFDKEINFSNYTGTGRYIAFKIQYQGSSTSYAYMDNLEIRIIPTCPRPTQLSVSNILPNSVNLNWTENGTATTWDIEYGPTGFTPGNGTLISGVTTFPQLISGLQPQTNYQVYVRSVCGVNDLSDWSTVFSFTTACVPVTSIPLIENFDTYTTGTGSFPTCWSKLTSNATYPYISTTNFSTPGSLYLYSSASGGYCHAITPMFDGTIPINTLKAEFKLRVSATDDTLYVGVMTDPTNMATFELVQKLIPTATLTWQDMEVFFNNYNGTGQYIAFKNVYTTTTTTIYIDNLEIYTIPSCPRPTNLASSNSTATSTTLSWTETGSAMSWNIEYGPIGFIPGSGTTIPASSNPFTLNGLTHSLCYDFYVQAVCSPTDLSMWSQKGSFCTAQIPVNVPFTIDFETPSGFQVANNSIGNNWYIGTDTANTVNNTTGGQNALYVSNDNGQTNAYTINSAGVVWAYRDVYFTPSTADYTLSFDWRLMGETGTWDYLNVYMGNITAPVPSTTSTITPPLGSDTLVTLLRQQATFQTLTLTLPFATYSGETKRIFFMWRNDGSLGNQPPAAVDNISITSTGITSCVPPSNVLVSNISANSATVTWTPGATETEWELDYKLTSATTWTTVLVATNPTTNLSTLLPASNYDVRVRAVCGASEFSGYTPIHTFTTTNTPCDVPTNLQVTNITDQSALATWNAGTAISWQVEYKLVSSANWTSASTTTPSFQISGLQSSSNYEIRVKAICSSNESAFTTNVPFTTTGGTVTYTITATAGANGTITPSGAVIVNQGASQTFNFAPSTGYIVSVVTVDGSPITGAPTSYTFTNVSANRTIHVDFISGISENELAQLVELFPNPTSSTIELRLKSEDLHVKECKIYDMYGKLMKTFPINAETTSIDVTDFASGVYFVRMDSEIGTISKKFVKK